MLKGPTLHLIFLSVLVNILVTNLLIVHKLHRQTTLYRLIWIVKHVKG